MNQKTILLLMVLFISKTSFSQEKKNSSYNFTIKQCIEYANQNQADVKNAGLDEEIAQAKVREIIGIGLPQINAGVDVKYFAKLPTSLIPAKFFGGRDGEFLPISFGTKYNMTPSIDASQLVFDGSYLVGLQAAKVYTQMAQKATEKSKIDIAANISKAYYSVLINEEHAKLIDINIERTKKLLSDSKALYENGFIEKIDIDRISVLNNNLVSEKEKIQRLIALSYYLLKFQMGMDISSELSLTEKLTEIDFKAIPMPSVNFDYSKKIEYAQMQILKKLKELDLKRYQVAYLPSIVAYGSLSSQAQRDKFDFFDTKQSLSNKWYPIGLLGAKLNIPIFDGLQKLRKINQASLEIEKTNNTMKLVSQSIDLQIESAKTNLLNSINSMETQKKNMELADEVFKVVKTKYEEGVGSNLEIINAEAAQKESRINYYSALYDAIIAKIDLEKATGTLGK